MNQPMYHIINYHLLEALNGILWVVVFWMFFFLLHHFHWLYKENKKRQPKLKWMNNWAMIRKFNKPEIALSLIIFSLGVRQMMLWWLRFQDNHKIDDQFFGYHLPNYNGIWLIDAVGAWVVTLGTLGLVIGVSYWIKVISPYKNGKALAIWITMISTALFIGVGGALLP